MSFYIEPAQSLSEAWLRTLEHVNQRPKGHDINVITTVLTPQSPEDPVIREALGERLAAKGTWGITTVANTLFPSALYVDPGMEWRPRMPAEEQARIDAAANGLYNGFLSILPTLKTLRANNSGTYFSRMVTWPGKEAGGVNQLAARIHYLRLARTDGRMTHNASDIAIGGEAHLMDPADVGMIGVQQYAATDDRPLGFPCLVHIDLTVHQGTLHLSAVYRHWYVITRGYGNLVGLARLQKFLAQQTGLAAGEIVINATFANAEHRGYGGRTGVADLIQQARSSDSLAPEDVGSR